MPCSKNTTKYIWFITAAYPFHLQQGRIAAVKFIEHKQVLPKLAGPLNTTGYIQLPSILSLGLPVSTLGKSSTALMNMPNLITFVTNLRAVQQHIDYMQILAHFLFIADCSLIISYERSWLQAGEEFTYDVWRKRKREHFLLRCPKKRKKKKDSMY